MVPIVTFIGWHDSGKTTIASKVVRHLKELGYRVAVIKSSKETDIEFDTPGTDTFKHKEAGADSVLFVAPDQMVLQTKNNDTSLTTLAYRYFQDVDVVIGEGFKQARQVAKIEVFRNSNQMLRDKVHGVKAIVTDKEVSANYVYVFKLNETKEIASFIEKNYLKNEKKEAETTSLLINGKKIMLQKFVQKCLAGTVYGFVRTLKLVSDVKEIELRISLNGDMQEKE